MKFKTLKMKNFMRYKGVNEVNFSCDDEHNVTVILGDNTVGKTTIAQAFRWCLYGAIMVERGKKESDYELLNNDVLAKLDANGRATVFVEITALDNEKLYTIHREAEYMRVYPKFITGESFKTLKMYVADVDSPDSKTEVEAGVNYNKINELINELFPKNLSHYFLFDGERWSDFSVNGVRENIKESVHILTGLSSYKAAMFHLKDMGANSVIKKLKSNIQGKGNMYDDFQQELTKTERDIEKYRRQIESIEADIRRYNKKAKRLKSILRKTRTRNSFRRHTGSHKEH